MSQNAFPIMVTTGGLAIFSLLACFDFDSNDTARHCEPFLFKPKALRLLMYVWCRPTENVGRCHGLDYARIRWRCFGIVLY